MKELYLEAVAYLEELSTEIKKNEEILSTLNGTIDVGDKTIEYHASSKAKIFAIGIKNSQIKAARDLGLDEEAKEFTQEKEDFLDAVQLSFVIADFRNKHNENVDFIREATCLLTLEEKRELFIEKNKK